MIRVLGSRAYALRNGVRFKSLKYLEPPNIYADASAAIKTSLSGRFLADGDIDWLSDEIQPALVIDGAEYPVGIFRAGSASLTYAEYGRVYQVEAYDRGYYLQLNKTESVLHLPAGTNYIDAIERLLTYCGIARVLKTPTAYTLMTDREDWDTGTDYLTIVNQLLSEINYNDLWFDSNGFAVLEPTSTPSANNIDHIYNATAVKSVTARDCTVETDFFDKANVFVVICSNPDLEEVMVARAENNNPNSATSIIRRGLRVTTVEKVDNIASQEALQAYADELCFNAMLASEVVTIETALMPNHGIRDVIALNHPAAQGIYEETAWYMELKAGAYMRHELKKVVFS